MSMQQPTLAELRPGVREFRCEGTHRMIRADNGKFVEERIGVEYVPTAGAGTLREEDWTRLAEEAVEREGKGVLLAAIMTYCEERCAWLRTYTALRKYALEILAGRDYEKWKDFHNPEVVELEDYF